MFLVNKCVSKVINIWCRLLRFINRKGWNIYWFGCRLLLIFAFRSRRFITIVIRLR